MTDRRAECLWQLVADIDVQWMKVITDKLAKQSWNIRRT